MWLWIESKKSPQAHVFGPSCWLSEVVEVLESRASPEKWVAVGRGRIIVLSSSALNLSSVYWSTEITASEPQLPTQTLRERFHPDNSDFRNGFINLATSECYHQHRVTKLLQL